ncbi:hypothetical protein H2201_008549 [Coniosporium apollinis]|uniref:BZIP domain-containing protein n=1 Tax=Coniosporium apollinis TaxID=61459 RepID=A0ABQ9NFX2_9PEZI|nr:hypothetical protein H2201_008549 [Coniosporium apollinis]
MLDSNSVPDRGDPDRKRALNVLAQRRYRQRKRDRMLALEGKVRAASTTSKAHGRTEVLSVSEKRSDSTPEENVETLRSDLSASQSIAPITPSPRDAAMDPASSAMSMSGWCAAAMPWAGDIDSGLGCSSWRQDDSVVEGSALITFDTFLSPSDADLGQELHGLETLQFTFPDDALLDVPLLQVLKAGISIAQMLGCEHSMWDPNTLRVFDAGEIPGLILPPNLEPTEVQKRIPHHPLFDILPWPSIRSKLICIFAQPPEARPPSARDPLAVLQMAYDIDDPVEGFRIAGADGFDGGNWEIGQAFFRNWWWALDRAIVERSNALRAKRGADRLRFVSG